MSTSLLVALRQLVAPKSSTVPARHGLRPLDAALLARVGGGSSSKVIVQTPKGTW